MQEFKMNILQEQLAWLKSDHFDSKHNIVLLTIKGVHGKEPVSSIIDVVKDENGDEWFIYETNECKRNYAGRAVVRMSEIVSLESILKKPPKQEDDE
jgi:hypothetical protein